MRYLRRLILLLLLFTSAAYAELDTFVGVESIDTFVGVESIDEAVGVAIAGGAPPAGQDFIELWDFSGNIALDSNWDVETVSTETLDANGSVLVTPDGDDFKAYSGIYQTPVDSINQYGLVELANLNGNAGTIGATLRQASADGTGACYSLAVRWSGSEWQFGVERYTGISFGELIPAGTRINIATPVSGYFLGFAVTGTGDNTVFKYWDFGNSDPGVFSTWGAATQTQTGNPVTPVNTGNYIGVWIYFAQTGLNDHTYEEWRGGDQ
jgi:hypothetical protein